MVSCSKHILFFSNDCEICKKEYCLMKGLNEDRKLTQQNVIVSKDKKQNCYKEFTEERAKQLYEKLFIFYSKKIKMKKKHQKGQKK